MQRAMHPPRLRSLQRGAEGCSCWRMALFAWLMLLLLLLCLTSTVRAVVAVLDCPRTCTIDLDLKLESEGPCQFSIRPEGNVLAMHKHFQTEYGAQGTQLTGKALIARWGAQFFLSYRGVHTSTGTRGGGRMADSAAKCQNTVAPKLSYRHWEVRI